MPKDQPHRGRAAGPPVAGDGRVRAGRRRGPDRPHRDPGGGARALPPLADPGGRGRPGAEFRAGQRGLWPRSTRLPGRGHPHAGQQDGHPRGMEPDGAGRRALPLLLREPRDAGASGQLRPGPVGAARRRGGPPQRGDLRGVRGEGAARCGARRRGLPAVVPRPVRARPRHELRQRARRAGRAAEEPDAAAGAVQVGRVLGRGRGVLRERLAPRGHDPPGGGGGVRGDHHAPPGGRTGVHPGLRRGQDGKPRGSPPALRGARPGRDVRSPGRRGGEAVLPSRQRGGAGLRGRLPHPPAEDDEARGA